MDPQHAHNNDVTVRSFVGICHIGCVGEGLLFWFVGGGGGGGGQRASEGFVRVSVCVCVWVSRLLVVVGNAAVK